MPLNPIRPNFWLINSVLAAAYFVFGILCSSIAGDTLLVPILFIPEGIALAAAMIFGWRCGVGVFAGQLALALFNDVNYLGAIGVAVVNGLETVIAAILVRRWGIEAPITRYKDYGNLLFLVLGVLQPFSAVLSNGVLWYLGDIQSWSHYSDSVAVWWSSNALGQALIAPFLLFLFFRQDFFKTIKSVDWFAVFLLPVATLAIFVVGSGDATIAVILLLPPILLAASRGQFGLFSASATVAAILASLATSYGLGPFVQYAPKSYSHLNMLFFGTFVPAQIICLLFKELQTEKSQVEVLSEERVEFLTYFDPLTQLPNRTLADSLLLTALEDGNAKQTDTAIVLVDLDDFRHVNDAYGQAVGDSVLKQISARIKSTLKSGDHLCRIGGDSFLVIIPKIDCRHSLNERVQALIDALSITFLEGDKRIDLTASCGVVSIRPNDDVSPEMVIRDAESALYCAKRDGKNVYRHYNPQLQESAANFAALADGLRIALDRKELSIRYQPQIDLSSGAIVGAEALLRWHVPTLGLLSPTAFIRIAERSGLIVSIGEWVLRSVCEQMAAWRRQGLPLVPVSVNISAIQIHRTDVGEFIQRTLAENHIDPGLLTLEITESTLLQKDEAVQAFLEKIEALGVGLSIDDFGTGFSNLAYVRRLRISCLKIDQSFVQGMRQSDADQTIVKSVIDLAEGLGAVAVAEGVEDEETLNLLKAMGCRQGQGYFFARPLDIAAYEQYLKSVQLLASRAPADDEASVAEPEAALLYRPNDKYELLFDRAPLGLALVDHATGAFKEVNQTLLDWTGYTKQEFMALSFWDITPRKYEIQELAQINQMNQTGRFGPNFKEYIRKDGSRFPIKISAFKAADAEGNVVVWGIIENLESLPEGQTPSANPRPSLKTISELDMLFDAICMVDQAGRFVFVSQAVERIFGYAPDEMIGRPMIDFVYEPDRAQTLETAQRVMTGNYVNHFENRYRRKDGSVADIMWTARWSEKDQLRIAVARDITVRKRQEQQLTALYNISEASNQAYDLNAFFKSLHQILVQQLATDSFMVVLKEPESGQFRLADVFDAGEASDCDAALIPETLCREVIQRNEPIRLEEEALRVHPDYPSLNDCGNIQALIGIPMHANGQTIGLLVLKRYASKDMFSQKDIELLEYVSNQVAAAIDRLNLQEKLRYQALYDELTQLPNRALFNDRLRAAIARAQRESIRLVLFYLDVNDFKWVNDTYGHAVGDQLLQTVAARISKTIRASDTVARIGGDEFVCIFEGDLPSDGVVTLNAKIRNEINGTATINGHELAVSVSVGAAVYPDDGATMDQLLSAADKSMYVDKARIKDGKARQSVDWTL